jgi:hypothetical protein
MKIKNLNIRNSTVTIADSINNIGNINWGISEYELSQLSGIISSREQEFKAFVQDGFDSKDAKNLSPEKKGKFIDGLKKFGIDFASKLSTSGIIELLKFYLLHK